MLGMLCAELMQTILQEEEACMGRAAARLPDFRTG